jgi:hypothetical protein
MKYGKMNYRNSKVSVEVGFLYYEVPVTAIMQGRDKTDTPHSMGKSEVKRSLHKP